MHLKWLIGEVASASLTLAVGSNEKLASLMCGKAPSRVSEFRDHMNTASPPVPGRGTEGRDTTHVPSTGDGKRRSYLFEKTSGVTPRILTLPVHDRKGK